MLPTPPLVSAPVIPSTTTKPVTHTAPVVRPWIPPQAQSDSKSSTRDPRLNRTGLPATPQPKEQASGKKDTPPPTGSLALTSEKPPVEKLARSDKPRIPRKEVSEEKKSKSPSPLSKSVQRKNKPEAEHQKSDGNKKDPRLRKRTQDKTGDGKDDEQKEKKRCNKEKEEAGQGAEPQRISKAKPINGVITKHDCDESMEKVEFKTGGNARTHARKRTRSRSRSRSPTFSPKRKDRRSPKGQSRSSSLSPSPSHKSGKARRLRQDEVPHGKLSREDRLTPKKNQSESRRPKRPLEDRHAESRDSHSPRGHDEVKEAKDVTHRRSSWEDKKQ